MSANYHPDPKTPREHCDNCAFQLANVQGWLGADDPACALIKAECLRDAVNELIASLQPQTSTLPL